MVASTLSSVIGDKIAQSATDTESTVLSYIVCFITPRTLSSVRFKIL